jgi:hypothetical protein
MPVRRRWPRPPPRSGNLCATDVLVAGKGEAKGGRGRGLCGGDAHRGMACRYRPHGTHAANNILKDNDLNYKVRAPLARGRKYAT